MDIYREEILEQWQNPRNYGEMRNSDVVVDQINPLCGDELRFFFKFEKKGNSKSETRNPRIKKVSFTGNGCAISIAASSMLTQRIKGKDVEWVGKIKGDNVLEMLGGKDKFPPARLKCAFLGLEAVKKLTKGVY